MMAEETRKGLWTEEEDLLLMRFVRVFGDHRWDFVAKFSGLNRTGKSCRLRWVNYLHPGLKRGRMTPQEKRLVLELHSIWGNRWSKIARRLPGRTDNEIKNYWRTHTRKKAQEKKWALSQPLSSPSNCFSLPQESTTYGISLPESQVIEGSLHEHDHKGITGDLVGMTGDQSEEEVPKVYSMDQIWKEIALMEEDVSSRPVYVGYEEPKEDGQYSFLCPPTKEDGKYSVLCPPTPMASASSWNCCSDSLWRMDDQEGLKMPLPTLGDYFVSDYGNGIEYHGS
ncbi:hypothetical protein NE237_008788 [Protea cynaroides]|uniref:Uncharacterized protein n=1 Tax=Protea cynaroides TaxID=273540 RepID=A0A9Q0KW77_9MAGN|nr:hypothetical protein NE237_008788 [Protea cynaroides]